MCEEEIFNNNRIEISNLSPFDVSCDMICPLKRKEVEIKNLLELLHEWVSNNGKVSEEIKTRSIKILSGGK